MKQKTKKSVYRRFKITGSGKVTRRVAFGRHLRSKKSASQKRNYAKKLVISGRIARRIRRAMAIA